MTRFDQKEAFLGFVQKYYFFGVFAEILLSRVIASRLSCAGLFFRGCAEILIFGEIFTYALVRSLIVVLNVIILVLDHII